MTNVVEHFLSVLSVSDEESGVSSVGRGLRDLNHATLDVEVEVVGYQSVTVEQVTFTLTVSVRSRSGLDEHELLEHVVFILIEERCDFSSIDRGVKLEEGSHGWDRENRSDVRDEEVDLTAESVHGRVLSPDSQLFGILVRGCDLGEELGASTQVELAVDGESVLTTSLNGGQLISVSFLDESHDTLIGRSRGQGGANGQKSVHSLTLSVDGTVLVRSSVVLFHPVEEDENGDKDLDSVGESSQREVSEPDVVVGGDVARCDLGEQSVLAQIHVLHRLKCERRVTKQKMNSEQAN